MLVENNPESFKKAIVDILSDSKLRATLIENGLTVTNRINSDIMEEKEEKLYLKLLEKN